MKKPTLEGVCFPDWRSRWRCPAALAAIFILCVISTPRIMAAAASSKDLAVVDCLLPGQIRQLGNNRTYLSARRPLKTTAAECALRGGEYVLADQANQASALLVWLPAAQAGDVAAMVNVGEIYQKGIGLAPDYRAAAHWFEAAAAAGSSSAYINLAQLYEKGLGVPQNPQLALSFYRKASGLEDDLVLDPGSLVAPPVAQGSELHSQERAHEALERARAEAQALRADLVAAERALQESQQSLQQLENQLEAGARNGAAAQEAENGRSKALAELQQQEVRLKALEAELAERESQVLLAQRETGASAQQLLQAESALEEARLSREKYRAELAAAQAALDKARQSGSNERAELDRLQQLYEQSEQRSQQQEAIIAQLQGERDKLQGRTEQIESELSALQAYEEAIKTQAVAGPSITMIDPLLPQTRATTPVVKVRGQQSSRQIIARLLAPAGLLSLTVNDEPLAANPQGIFRAVVPLDRAEVPVSIVAIDNQGKRETREFVLRSEELAALQAIDTGDESATALPALEFGNYHALVIGINDYEKLPRLRTAVNDANAVADLLGEKYGFKVTRLLNASRYDILSALNGMRESLTSDDNLLIYYAGHGELDRVNMRGHWLPVDAEADNSANWISNVAVTDMLNIINARSLMVVADSCYSGSLTRSALSQLDGALTAQERLNWLKSMVKKRSRTVLTSGGLAPTLDEGGGEHSVFARAFLDVLQHNGGLMDGLNLYKEVSARVALAASQMRYEQVPEYAPLQYAGHEGGDFFIVPARQ